MADLTLTATVGTFPSGASYSVQQFADAFAARLELSIPGDTVLFGQLGGAEPVSPLPGNGDTPGVWLNEGSWWTWDEDSAAYLPAPLRAGQIVDGTVYTTLIASGASSANTTLTTPDKDGVIATIGDAIAITGTQTPTGTAITLDWTLKKQAYIILSGNTTVVNAGQEDGQYQDIWMENNATSYTGTFSGVQWSGGTAPTITTASAGQRRIDHIRLYHVGDNTFGEAVKQNYQFTTGSDSTPPSPTTYEGFGSTVYVTFSELLQGGDMGTPNFLVKKGTGGGTTQTITSATASGNHVALVLSASFGASATVKVQYTGSTIKDLSGNLAAAIPLTKISITSSAGS